MIIFEAYVTTAADVYTQVCAGCWMFFNGQ